MSSAPDTGPSTSSAGARGSALYVGSVRHRRLRPRVNAFRYRTYHALLDVDDLPELDRELLGFGYNRRAVTGFRDTDHLGPGASPVRVKLERWLRLQGVDPPGGSVRVLTNLRVLGHVFDPVSWWFCHHPDGSLALVVAEVHNTFGESYCYLLDQLEKVADGSVRAETSKRFHVSPFLPVEGVYYRFVFADRAGSLTAHMDVFDGAGKVFDATQRGRRIPLTSRTLFRTLLTHPLMTLRTVVLIHLQAFRLVAKRVPWFRKPEPPRDAGSIRGGVDAERDRDVKEPAT